LTGMADSVPGLPDSRGPLTAVLFHELRDAAHRLPPIVLPDVTHPLADEDVQLALYVLYELHYRGFDGVDERWEWEPSLLALRAVLEDIFEGGLFYAIGPPDDDLRIAPEDMDVALRGVADAEDAPSLSEHLEREGTHDHFREFAIHRSAYQLKEADPHSWAIPRLAGAPKAALVEIQSDEYGGGRAERMHAQLFADAMAGMGLDATYGAHLDVIPGVTLATVNLMSLMGLHRRWRGGIAGHLALFEMTSSLPNGRYARGLRRLGLDAATAFFDEHVEADAVHENIAAVDLAGGLARAEPQLTGQILWGARALAELDARWARHLLGCWERGVSSLRAAAPSRAPA
jgi:Iron-containing redox enzyme